MKKIILISLILSLTTISFCQTTNSKNVYLNFSGGRVSFGSGDFLGYSFSFEACQNIMKKSSFAVDKLLLGGELIFETGVKNPIIENPTLDQFFGRSFQHVSSTILWPKISYYPFRKIINGFNIQVGPTIGYSYRSQESRASRIVDILGNSTRQSTLYFDNGFIVGYRVSTGIEFNLTKKLLTGFRIDFSNNTEGEINTLTGLKFGIKL